MTKERIAQLRVVVDTHPGHRSSEIITECLDEIERLKRQTARKPQTELIPRTANIPINGDAEVYAAEIGLKKVELAEFLDYFQARGWRFKDGRPVKCWKSAMRQWKRNTARFNPDSPKKTVESKDPDRYAEFISKHPNEAVRERFRDWKTTGLPGNGWVRNEFSEWLKSGTYK